MNAGAEEQDALVFLNGLGDRLDVVRYCIHYHGVVGRLGHRDLLCLGRAATAAFPYRRSETLTNASPSSRASRSACQPRPAGSQCSVVVSFVEATEWLQYSINVATAGVYAIEVQGTNGSTGGSFHIEIDGINVSGALAAPNTGDNWIVGTVTIGGISMGAGPHVVRIVVDQEAAHTWVGNFDPIRFIQP